MRWEWVGVVAVSFAVATPRTTSAQSLAFSPQRVVMDARAGNASLTLTNTGKRQESYRVELVDMIYHDDGRVAQTQKAPPGYPSAKELIRFSPSQVRLGAGESQKIRILLKTQDRLADGEYRVHAVLRQLPNVTDVKVGKSSDKAIAGVLGVEQAIAIPVIVRRGQTSATGKIASLKIVEGKISGIDLQLGRNGNRSLYTNLILRDKAGAVVSEVKGVAVPVPNATRRFVFQLAKVAPASVKAGGYTLEMVDHDTGAVIDKKPVR